MADSRSHAGGRFPAASALCALVLAGAACRAPNPQDEMAVSDVETYWAVESPAGATQYIAPVVRFRLLNKSARPHRSIQALGTFRRQGESEAWSSAFTPVAPLAGKALEPGQSTLVVLKPEGEGRYTSTVPPEQMLSHEQFKDVSVEVYIRVGASTWTRMAQAGVERRLGPRLAAAAQ